MDTTTAGPPAGSTTRPDDTEPTDEELDITIDLREFDELLRSDRSRERRIQRRLNRPSPWRWTIGGVMLGISCFVIGTLTLLDDIFDGAPGVDLALSAWAWASTYIAASGVVLTIAETVLDGR